MGLDGVELVLECEEAFGIKIPDADASATMTVGELQALCMRLIEVARGTPLGNAERFNISETVRVIVSEQLGVKMDRVVPEARFVEDLGLI